jgi:hypothetical protein
MARDSIQKWMVRPAGPVDWSVFVWLYGESANFGKMSTVLVKSLSRRWKLGWRTGEGEERNGLVTSMNMYR